jgi:hypothetical protein
MFHVSLKLHPAKRDNVVHEYGFQMVLDRGFCQPILVKIAADSLFVILKRYIAGFLLSARKCTMSNVFRNSPYTSINEKEPVV